MKWSFELAISGSERESFSNEVLCKYIKTFFHYNMESCSFEIVCGVNELFFSFFSGRKDEVFDLD